MDDSEALVGQTRRDGGRGGGGDGLLVQGWGFKCQLANVMLRVRVGVKGASGLVVVVSD